jgi:hypothetical protein
MGIWEDIRKTFRNGNNLTKLIYINIAVFILITITAVIGFLLNNQFIAEYHGCSVIFTSAYPSSMDIINLYVPA